MSFSMYVFPVAHTQELFSPPSYVISSSTSLNDLVFGSKNCLAAVTQMTPLRDGTTFSDTHVYLLRRLMQFRDFDQLYAGILALTKNTLATVVVVTVLSKFCFKVGPDENLFTIERK